MVYTGRLVIIGKTGKDPFVGFVLASNSFQNRRLEQRNCANAKRLYVLPSLGHERDNLDYPDLDNYPCIIGDIISEEERDRHVMIAFNGHMSKRCLDHLKNGTNPMTSLDLTLLDFTGALNDSRVGALFYVDSKKQAAYLGINDRDNSEKRVKKISLEDSSGVYTCVKNTSMENKLTLPYFDSATELAAYLAREMIPCSENVIAAGVCVLRKGEFDIAAYNTL